MAGFPAGAGMSAILEAIKQKGAAVEDQLTWCRDYRVSGPLHIPPWNTPMLYIMPMKPLQEQIGEQHIFWYTHRVMLDVVVQTYEPDDEKIWLGGLDFPPLPTMLEEVASYYENNLLGLSGLETDKPVCEIEDYYMELAEEEDITSYLISGRVIWSARIKAFQRPTDT